MAVALALPGLRARAWLRRKGFVIDQIDAAIICGRADTSPVQNVQAGRMVN
jgi:hypothetical protein